MRADFAVVIPAFDEAPNVPDLIREIRAVFDTHDLSGEVILVDDGSSDGTAELAETEGAGWSPLKVLRHLQAKVRLPERWMSTWRSKVRRRVRYGSKSSKTSRRATA